MSSFEPLCLSAFSSYARFTPFCQTLFSNFSGNFSLILRILPIKLAIGKKILRFSSSEGPPFSPENRKTASSLPSELCLQAEELLPVSHARAEPSRLLETVLPDNALHDETAARPFRKRIIFLSEESPMLFLMRCLSKSLFVSGQPPSRQPFTRTGNFPIPFSSRRPEGRPFPVRLLKTEGELPAALPLTGTTPVFLIYSALPFSPRRRHAPRILRQRNIPWSTGRRKARRYGQGRAGLPG